MKKNLNIAYLNGAEGIRRTNALSGGNESGKDDNNSFEYLEISSISYDTYLYDAFVALSHLCKFDFEDKVEILPGGLIANIMSTLGNKVHEFRNGRTFVMVDLNRQFTGNDIFLPSQTYTSKDFLINMLGITEERINSLPRITKEEFYNLDNIDS